LWRPPEKGLRDSPKGGPAIEFETEVFISYAHLDNQPLTEGATGWVSQFHRALQIRVGQLMGKEPTIWRDPKLQGNDYFGDELIARLPRVGVLVSVLTPRYVKSEWCHRELEEFYKASEKAGGVRVMNKARIFKVLKTPLSIEQHPPEVRPLLGYEFFRLDPETGRARELDTVFGPEAQRDFWIRLDDLAQDVCALLTWLENGGKDPLLAAPDTDKGLVYLAQTSVDLKERRDAVRRDLLGQGYGVLPDRALPLTVAEVESAVNDALKRCRLSVHLVGRNYGVVPDGTDRSVEMLQYELAVRRADAGGFFRLVWMPAGLEIEDERQRRFVGALRADPRIQDSADLLETTFEDLNTQIHIRLEHAAPAAAVHGEAASDVSVVDSVYVVCDQRDLGQIGPLTDFLFERYEVVLPAFEGDEADVRADHEENLRSCSAVLIYYGAANELWLRRELRQLQKIAGLGRSRPLRAKAILIAPPLAPQKAQLRTHEALVLQQSESFEPACLQPFLAQLRRRDDEARG